MRITVGNTLLGDREEDIPIGGFSASGSRDIQQIPGTCDGSLRQLRDRGNIQAEFNVPTVRKFDTIQEAEKYVVDTAAEGGVVGAALFEYDGGAVSEFQFAAAFPSFTYVGLSVRAVWNIQIGDRFSD